MDFPGYDAWKLRAPDVAEPEPTPCPVCTGDRDAEPCSEECYELGREFERWTAARRRMRHLYCAARTALTLARRYRAEDCVERRDWRADRRIIEILAAVRAHRASIRALRSEAA